MSLATRAALALATLAGVFALYQLRHAALLLLLSISVAAAIEPAVQALVRRGVPRGVAIGLVYAVCLGLATLGIYQAIRALPVELSSATSELRRMYDRARDSLPARGALGNLLAERLPDAARLLDGAGGGSIGGEALGLTASVFNVGAEIAIVLVLSIFWSASAQPFELLWLSLLPAAHRARARHGWKALRDGVGLELRSAIVQSLGLAVAAALIFRALGLPYPMLAALGLAALRLIPIIGPPMLLAVALLCGLSHGPLIAALVAAAVVALLLSLRLIVAERGLGARRLHPLLVGTVLAALWECGGFPALFIAAPIAAALAIFEEQLIALTSRLAPETMLAHVAGRVVELEQILARSPPQRPELVSVAARLATLVREAASTVAPLIPTPSHSPGDR